MEAKRLSPRRERERDREQTKHWNILKMPFRNSNNNNNMVGCLTACVLIFLCCFGPLERLLQPVARPGLVREATLRFRHDWAQRPGPGQRVPEYRTVLGQLGPRSRSRSTVELQHPSPRAAGSGFRAGERGRGGGAGAGLTAQAGIRPTLPEQVSINLCTLPASANALYF